MPPLTLAVYNRSGAQVAMPKGLDAQVSFVSALAQGGYDAAELEITGPVLSLHALRSWLRYRVEVRSYGGLAWEGFVESINLRLGGVTVSAGTERMYNAIKVIYSYTGDDGGSETGETEWGVDADSINEFGRKEAIHSSGGETTREAAEALRATVLAGAAKAVAPAVSVEGADADLGATLYCKGRFHGLEDRYHLDDGGYEAHEITGGRVLLGWTYTANTIGFIAGNHNRIIDYASKLEGLDEGDQLDVTGSTLNNNIKVIKNGVGGESESYTAGTISFDPADDIKDSAKGLGFIRAREALTVAGSTANDGRYFVGEVTGAERVETAEYGAWPVVAESAGANITLTMHQSVEMAFAPTTEAAGSTITMTAHGQKVAMRFELTNGPWLAGEVGIHIAKYGTPTDNVIVELWTDAGDVPSSLLASGTLAAIDVPSQTAAWRTVKLGTPVMLANAARYHIVVRRAGASHHENYYTLSVDLDAEYERGDLRLWGNSAWHVRYAGTAHLAFKLWATMDSTVKIAEIVASVAPGMVTECYAPALSNVRTRRFRDGRTTAWEEVLQLLKTGDNNGRRLLATVRPGGAMVVEAEKDYDAALALVWGIDGVLRDGRGRPVYPGYLPVGRWVRIESLTVADWQAETTCFLVDSAEYDGRTGRWALRPKEAIDPFDLSTEQG